MKTVIYISQILLIGVFNCTDNNIDTSSFTIFARSILDNSSISGGQYRIINSKNETIATYILNKENIEVSNLPIGEYTIEEVSSPDGYVTEHKQQKYDPYNIHSREIIFYYIDEQNRTLPESLKLKFYASEHYEYYGEYNAVRIGKYYWIDKNFTHPVRQGNGFENDLPITQATLDKYIERIRINPAQYQLDNINDFNQYYGRHYSYLSILYMNQQGFMLNERGERLKGWKLPSSEDYRQLFAMCPFNTSRDTPHRNLNERDVRFTLGTKKGDNKLAYDIANPENNIYSTYWFDPQYVTNKYKFNLMPGGARLNGDGPWCNGLGPSSGCYPDGLRGDIYHLFYTAYLAVDNPDDSLYIGVIMLHSMVDTQAPLCYHYLNVRWCRRLTDFELGYKLYINSDQTDIKKLKLDEPIPDRYAELPHGYVRGFYVQYILNNPNPTVTVKDIVEFSRSVEDNYVRSNRSNSSIIL